MYAFMDISKILIGLLSLIILALTFSSLVEAGYLTATSSPSSGGTTFTIQWRQGFNSGMVYYFNGDNYLSFSGLNLGPNACYKQGRGDTYAIHANISADASGPYSPDAVVRCDLCDCESRPNTDFLCRKSAGDMQYRCEACDACVPDPCTEWYESCTHIDCFTSKCDCDPDKCDRERDWSECNYNTGGKSCGTFSGTKTRDVRSCTLSGTCEWDVESNSCTETLSCSGGLECCSDGSCNWPAGCCAVDCPPPGDDDRCDCMCGCNCMGDSTCYLNCMFSCV